MTTRLAATLLLSFAALQAQAAPVTAVPPGLATDVITFDPFAASPATAFGGFNQVDVGTPQGLEPVLLSTNDDSITASLGDGQKLLGSNGSWPADGAYAGLNANSGNMTFTFGRGLSFVGAFLNFDPLAHDGGAAISVYAQDGSLLEDSVPLTFDFQNAAGTGLGGFFGFSRSAADIYAVTFSDAQIVVDNLTFDSAPRAVPEPGSLALVALTLGALALATRRR